jgi:hypothetical protein
MPAGTTALTVTEMVAPAAREPLVAVSRSAALIAAVVNPLLVPSVQLSRSG